MLWQVWAFWKILFSKCPSARLLAQFLLQLFAELLAKFLDGDRHLGIAGGVHQRFANARNDLDAKLLHFGYGHFLGPQVNFHRSLVVGVPDGQGNGAGLLNALVGIVGGVPIDFFGNIVLVQIYGKVYL